jgi:hypothetical protein
MPRPKPKRYYLHHPWPRRYRRILYGLLGCVMALAYIGSSSLLGGDRIAPTLFALACAACFVGAVRVQSLTMWMVSGWATFAAFGWRLGQVLVIEAGWTSQEPPDSSAMAASVYVFACMSVPAVWRWLRPRGVDE